MVFYLEALFAGLQSLFMQVAIPAILHFSIKFAFEVMYGKDGSYVTS